MKIPVYSLKGEVKGSINISRAFSKPVREDIIKRAVVSEEASKRQPYGTNPKAGMRSSAHYHGRRSVRYSMMNREMARMKRIHGSGFLHMTARTVPQAVKGRKAHPPKAEKVFDKKINKKEKALAILSAIAASSDKDLVMSRGHRIENVKHIPLVLEDSFQALIKSSDVLNTLKSLGLMEELERSSVKKIRPGKGSTRGRKYRKKKGPLIIVSRDEGISRAARNLAGVDVLEAKNLLVSSLAPGSQPGRLCIWTESALNFIEKGEDG